MNYIYRSIKTFPGTVSISHNFANEDEASSLFETLASNAPIGIFYTGADGVAHYVNDVLAKTAGYPVEEYGRQIMA